MSFKFGEGKSGEAMPFKKFESADEIEDKKRLRQEEWEKVRRPDQPLTAPEEAYDRRSLYDKLQEQKQKAQDEHEAKHRLSNQVRGLEDDEAAFLDSVSDRQMELDSQRKKEEEQALDEFREAVASQANENPTEKKVSKAQPTSSKQSVKKSQLELLKGAVKRKTSDEPDDEKKLKLSDGTDNNQAKTGTSQPSEHNHSNSSTKTVTSHTMRLGGVLPGLCQYSDSTSDSNSSSSDSDELEDNTKTLPKPRQITITYQQ